MENLSPRQQSILNRVVDTHIETAEPVGSQAITSLYQSLFQDSYSPATVRHEMGLLEDMGYLMHPHTSAGRVPTDRGYRYYVDHGLREEEIPKTDFDSLTNSLYGMREEGERFAENLSTALSEWTEELCLVIVPRKRRHQVFLQGTSRILDKPEFQTLEKARMILRALDEKIKMTEWLLESAPEEGISVTIGRENGAEAFHDCTVISARCLVAPDAAVAFAVIGPRRMRYARTVPLVEKVARLARRMLQTDPSE